MSKQGGVVPDDLKQGLVNPLIKKQFGNNFGNNELKNFRSISQVNSVLSNVLTIVFMTIVLPSTCQMIYDLHLNDFTQLRRLLKIRNDIIYATWIMEN